MKRDFYLFSDNSLVNNKLINYMSPTFQKTFILTLDIPEYQKWLFHLSKSAKVVSSFYIPRVNSVRSGVNINLIEWPGKWAVRPESLPTSPQLYFHCVSLVREKGGNNSKGSAKCFCFFHQESTCHEKLEITGTKTCIDLVYSPNSQFSDSSQRSDEWNMIAARARTAHTGSFAGWMCPAS